MDLSTQNVDLIYQRIGEFVTSFQWIEQKFRVIGWLLLDPHHANWPLKELRNVTNHDLINQVNDLYSGVVGSLLGEGVKDYCDSFQFVVNESHEARSVRNSLLHSAFVELKAGGEVKGIMRSNPILKTGVNGDHVIESEVLTDDNLKKRIAHLGQIAVALNFHHVQLIAWSPFENVLRIDECGIPFHIDGMPFQKDM